MKRIITCIAILITAFAQTQAQHPRVCDYVSLKHALKGREFENVGPDIFNDDFRTDIIHTKEEIRIETINQYGEEIDSRGIINYKNDTVYIYVEQDLNGAYLAEIKTNKGAFRIYNLKDTACFFKPIELEEHVDEETWLDPSYEPSIYPDIFEWDGLERLQKDRNIFHGEDVWGALTRLVFNEYKLTYVDLWYSRVFRGSNKRDIALRDKKGLKNKLPVENEFNHIYDTISKKNNDNYTQIMYKDENRFSSLFEKGIFSFILKDIKNQISKELHIEPNVYSDVVYTVDENDSLLILDIIGLWYYVEPVNREGIRGWIKLNDAPGHLSFCPPSG